MATAVILAAVGVPIFILIMVLTVLIYGSRSKIYELKVQQDLIRLKITDIYDHLNLIGEWSMAAQEQIKVPGFGN